MLAEILKSIPKLELKDTYNNKTVKLSSPLTNYYVFLPCSKSFNLAPVSLTETRGSMSLTGITIPEDYVAPAEISLTLQLYTNDTTYTETNITCKTYGGVINIPFEDYKKGYIDITLEEPNKLYFNWDSIYSKILIKDLTLKESGTMLNYPQVLNFKLTGGLVTLDTSKYYTSLTQAIGPVKLFNNYFNYNKAPGSDGWGGVKYYSFDYIIDKVTDNKLFCFTAIDNMSSYGPSYTYLYMFYLYPSIAYISANDYLPYYYSYGDEQRQIHYLYLDRSYKKLYLRYPNTLKEPNTGDYYIVDYLNNEITQLEEDNSEIENLIPNEYRSFTPIYVDNTHFPIGPGFTIHKKDSNYILETYSPDNTLTNTLTLNYDSFTVKQNLHFHQVLFMFYKYESTILKFKIFLLDTNTGVLSSKPEQMLTASSASYSISYLNIDVEYPINLYTIGFTTAEKILVIDQNFTFYMLDAKGIHRQTPTSITYYVSTENFKASLPYYELNFLDKSITEINEEIDNRDYNRGIYYNSKGYSFLKTDALQNLTLNWRNIIINGALYFAYDFDIDNSYAPKYLSNVKRAYQMDFT